MKKLELTSLEYTETQTVINFNLFDDSSDQSQPLIGAWTVNGNITKDEALSYAKSMVDESVTVSSSLL